MIVDELSVIIVDLRSSFIMPSIRNEIVCTRLRLSILVYGDFTRNCFSSRFLLMYIPSPRRSCTKARIPMISVTHPMMKRDHSGYW